MKPSGSQYGIGSLGSAPGGFRSSAAVRYRIVWSRAYSLWIGHAEDGNGPKIAGKDWTDVVRRVYAEVTGRGRFTDV
jgi:hypothetical protein